ncbi:MAG: hypothetical protein IJD96_06740 [Lachnospiraceae bacterium]|nr:hypothetical protein [Lachnospiraceae bacterium]
MKNYPNQELQVMPQPKPYHLMTDEELEQVLNSAFNYNILIPALIESNRRKDKIISELNKRILRLEEKTLKKAGRHKQTFLHNGKELTDDDIIYLIDGEYYDSIGKLEKAVGAGKNQFRNRYNKAKRNLKIERSLKKNGDN